MPCIGDLQWTVTTPTAPNGDHKPFSWRQWRAPACPTNRSPHARHSHISRIKVEHWITKPEIKAGLKGCQLSRSRYTSSLIYFHPAFSMTQPPSMDSLCRKSFDFLLGALRASWLCLLRPSGAQAVWTPQILIIIIIQSSSSSYCLNCYSRLLHNSFWRWSTMWYVWEVFKSPKWTDSNPTNGQILCLRFLNTSLQNMHLHFPTQPFMEWFSCKAEKQCLKATDLIQSSTFGSCQWHACIKFGTRNKFSDEILCGVNNSPWYLVHLQAWAWAYQSDWI